jgi:mono/diheme cytochrome c family protein
VPRRSQLGWVILGLWCAATVAGCGGTHAVEKQLDGQLYAEVPGWVKAERLPAAAIPGAKLFATGCTPCHTYLGSGSSNLGAPDLTGIGTRGLSVSFLIRQLKCPSCVHPGSPMPAFTEFGAPRLRQLAVFLEASKGPH